MPFILSLVRHGLSGLGAVLIAKGLAEPSAVEGLINSSVEVVGGVISAGAAILWSKAVHSRKK